MWQLLHPLRPALHRVEKRSQSSDRSGNAISIQTVLLEKPIERGLGDGELTNIKMPLQ